MSGEQEGAHLRVLPPLTEEEHAQLAQTELATIGSLVRKAVLSRSHVLVLSSKDTTTVAAYGSAVAFLSRFDRDYLDDCEPEEAARISHRYREAVEFAIANPGRPADLGDGDSVTWVQVQV